MKITCISASNTRAKGDKSTSIRVCNLIKEIVLKEPQCPVTVDVIPLMDYEVKPCILCGACFKEGHCVQDEEFNRILEALVEAQGIFLVVPHYSPIPAKLIMVFEKINEILYARWINDQAYQSPFLNKPVGIIGHGGMVENEKSLQYYHDRLITPVADTMRSLSFKVIGLDEGFLNGAAFGLKDDSC
ncbi:MAG: NAD(P)H-dependent oxidoreductase, partial [Bacillota bacterium]|nr:NAD(P)H-dependent oxidoreductase [Bacillota bacterium]